MITPIFYHCGTLANMHVSSLSSDIIVVSYVRAFIEIHVIQP